MDRIIELEDTVRREIEAYAGPVYKAKSYFIEDPERHIYVVVVIPEHDHPTDKKPAIVVMARIVDHVIVIDVDITDRPLYEELMRCGIPREQIVLAYAGETLANEPGKGA